MQVSLWFSPWLYNHKIIGGKWKIRSTMAEMLLALTAHLDFNANLMPMCICSMSHHITYVMHLSTDTCQFTWNIVENFTALLCLEDDITHLNMPKHADTTKSLKEFMLLEGEKKVTKTWKIRQLMSIKREEKNSDSECGH